MANPLLFLVYLDVDAICCLNQQTQHEVLELYLRCSPTNACV